MPWKADVFARYCAGMSQENVEVVRRNHDAFERQEIAIEGWDPEGEWIPAMAGAVEGKTYRGTEGLLNYSREFFGSFSEVRLENFQFKDLGDRVLVLYEFRVRGHDSGVAMHQSGGALFTFRSGKIIHGCSFLSQDEALEAAGLLSPLWTRSGGGDNMPRSEV